MHHFRRMDHVAHHLSGPTVTKDVIQSMAWVLGAAAEHALENRWTKKNFVDVAAYIYEIERPRHFHALAFKHYQRVNGEADVAAAQRVSKARRKKKAPCRSTSTPRA